MKQTSFIGILREEVRNIFIELIKNSKPLLDISLFSEYFPYIENEILRFTVTWDYDELQAQKRRTDLKNFLSSQLKIFNAYPNPWNCLLTDNDRMRILTARIIRILFSLNLDCLKKHQEAIEYRYAALSYKTQKGGEILI